MSFDESGANPRLHSRDREIRLLEEQLKSADSGAELNRTAVLAGLETIRILGDTIVANSSFKSSATAENQSAQAVILRQVLNANANQLIQPPLGEVVTAEELLTVRLAAANRIDEIAQSSYTNPLPAIDYRQSPQQLY